MFFVQVKLRTQKRLRIFFLFFFFKSLISRYELDSYKISSEILLSRGQEHFSLAYSFIKAIFWQEKG